MGYFIRLERRKLKSKTNPEVNHGPYKNIRSRKYSLFGWYSTNKPSNGYSAWSDTTHPTPEGDSKIKTIWNAMSAKEREKYVFGFRSLEQYRKWFYKPIGRIRIEKMGRLGIYKIVRPTGFPDHLQLACHSNYQSIAHASALKLIKILDPTVEGSLSDYIKE